MFAVPINIPLSKLPAQMRNRIKRVSLMKMFFRVHKAYISSLLNSAVKESLIIDIIALIIAISFNLIRQSHLPLFSFSSSNLIKHQQAQIPEISIREAFDLYLKKKVVFVDARDPLSFAEGHIADAINIYPDDAVFYASSLKTKLSADTLVITYCDGPQCPLSKETAHTLLQQGIPAVKVFVNGWQLWRDAGYPITKGKS
jgi:rhodanese-related sulfurtransferase